MNLLLRLSVLTLLLVGVAGSTALAHGDKNGPMACRDDWNSDRYVNHCEIREQSIPASGMLTVDARRNGGVTIKGSDRGDIFVRSKVQARAPSQGEAEALAKQVVVQTGGGKVVAQGPETSRESHWSVSYEILVPRRLDVSVETYNGGISISDVNGRVAFNAHNGGVALRRLGGTVKGNTQNGGLVVELSGDRWDGETLDVRTTNGGITMTVPENYSAHLETGTVNGHLSVDFPVTVQGRITRELAVDLGSGGPTVRVMTTNGGVKIKRAGYSNN